MSPELPDPISEVLEDTAGEARVQKIWRGIEDEQRARGGPRVGARVAVMSALAAAALLLLWLAWPEDGAAPVAHGPLRLSDGAALTAAEGPRTLALDDGSRIALDDGARVEPLRNDGGTVALLLAQGRARFEVEPGGPRTWTVESGVATVEVVGTAFTVARGDGWARVDVAHGTVVVRGERVPERAARLTAGESLVVGDEPTARAPEPAPEPIAAPDPPVRPRRAREPAPDVEALMARADEARRAGRLHDATSLLEQAAATDDPAAGVAAFTLGRLELDALRRPDRAARAFGRALELHLPPRLREDAAARLVEAHRAHGDASAADRAARAYLSDYPEGRHASRVRAALADP